MNEQINKTARYYFIKNKQIYFKRMHFAAVHFSKEPRPLCISAATNSSPEHLAKYLWIHKSSAVI